MPDRIRRTSMLFAAALAATTSACSGPYLPTWNANKISLGATASGILVVQNGCVVLRGERTVLPIWPAPTRGQSEGVATPSGDVIAFGTDLTLVGAYGQAGGRYWDRAQECGAVPFSVNGDGIGWPGQ